jgi:hypothetical protein
MQHEATRNGLSPLQKKLVAALVADPDIQAACRSVRIARSTCYRWMRDAAFSAALKTERDRVLDDALDRVKSHVTRAVDGLAALLKAKDPVTRRLACNDILRHAIKARELEDIQTRLDALESILRERGQL